MSDLPPPEHVEAARRHNAEVADDVVAALTQVGIADVFVCPGSRSTPLVFALERHHVRTTVLIDERVAGYAAVGAAQVGHPAAIVTTSGTAVANLLPGACEAEAAELPWVAVTADRPRALIGTGANQTLDQLPLLQGPARVVMEVPAFTDAEQSRRERVGDLVFALRPVHVRRRGPVHLDVRFSKPLEPPADHVITSTTAPARDDEDLTFERQLVEGLRQDLSQARRGLVIVGGLPLADRAPARRLVEALGWPAIVDVTSGLRRTSLPTVSAAVLRHADSARALAPDVVLQLGGTMTEEGVQRWLAALPTTSTRVLQLKSGSEVRDPEGRVDVVVTAPSSVWSALTSAPPSALASVVHRLDGAMRAAVDDVLAGSLSEPAVARAVLASMRAGEVLLLGNSMPVRDADRYADLAVDDVTIISNRGVSGIDGTIATALGACLTSQRPTTAFVGDLAALHDLGGIAATQQAQAPLRIVVVNNAGGGIFSFLPVAGASSALVERYFGTPHEFSLASIAAAMGLDAIRVDDLTALQACLATRPIRPELIEVVTTRADNVVVHQRLDAATADGCRAALVALTTTSTDVVSSS
ncbi:MAG TPA: 2-succinyl-5-enolpyruvyl-6-hydroxy-3-cyclohexene-1-carboxylic-acid synthase [Myxococcota bacterium]